MDIRNTGDLIINETTLPVISQLAEHMPGGFFIYHADGDQALIYYNGYLPAIFGCNGDDDAFKKLVGNSFKGIVHPEDYEETEKNIRTQIENSADRVDHVRYRFLRRDGSVGMMDDYGHFSHNETFGDIYYVFVQDITEQYSEEQKRKERIASISGSESTYIVYPQKNSFTVIGQNEYLEKNYRPDETYTQSISRYIEKDVYPADRNMLRESLEVQNLMSRIEEQKEFNLRYRDISAGYPLWYEMRAVGISNTEILLGFSNMHTAIISQIMCEKMQDSYFGQYYVNLDTGLARIIKTGHPEITGAAGRMVPFPELLRKIAATAAGEAVGYLNRFTDVAYVKQYFASDDTGYYVYKSNINTDTRWIAMTAHVLAKNEDGAPSDMTVTFSMLSEEASEKEEAKLKLEEALKAADEEMLRNDILHDLIHSGKWTFYLNSEDEIIGSNVSTEANRIICNDVADDGHSWLDIVHPDDRENASKEFYACIKDHSCNTPFDVNFRMMDREGTYRWFHTAGRMIRMEDGSGEFFGILEDITGQMEEQQKMDEILRMAAENSNRAKTEFLFNMSHDIRTPMNAILGYTEIALKHIKEPEKVADSLEKIKMSSGHLLNLINEILEMSRIEAGKLEITQVPVFVTKAAEGITIMSHALASTKDITFNSRNEEVKNPYVYADELHINQIIINLVSNAIKYTSPGGTVDYCFEQLGEPVNDMARYRITVKDNGIGMTEEFQKHLFENFSREESAAVSTQEGTGLGLAIVKRLVDIMGGTITVQSKKDVGSTFVVELSMRVMDDEAVEQFRAERDRNDVDIDISCLKGKRTLLVEDNELNREIAIEMLSEAGLEIDSAECGQEAVDAIVEKGADYYDFVLMDIQMPVMNGYEATIRIRQLPNADKLPIIALSANAFAEDKAASLASGMNDHVSKPIDMKELFRVLARFFR